LKTRTCKVYHMRFTASVAMIRAFCKRRPFTFSAQLYLLVNRQVKPIQNAFERDNLLIKTRRFTDDCYAWAK
jgi:hypothetical protein